MTCVETVLSVEWAAATRSFPGHRLHPTFPANSTHVQHARAHACTRADTHTQASTHKQTHMRTHSCVHMHTGVFATHLRSSSSKNFQLVAVPGSQNALFMRV